MATKSILFIIRAKRVHTLFAMRAPPIGMGHQQNDVITDS